LTNYGTVLTDADIQTGHWTSATRLFTAGGTPLNAIQVTTRRASENGNAVPTLFARLAGINSLDVSTTSVALWNARQYCILAIGTSGSAGVSLLSHGAPKADLSQCNIASNTSMRCDGSNLLAPIGDAHITNNGCGVVQNSNTPLVLDPYAARAANIPLNPTPCTNYNGQNLTGAPAAGSTTFSCGTLKLTKDITLTGNNNVIVVENGQLNTNGHTISTAKDASATIIFTGTNGSYSHTLAGSGTVDISAPTSGTWAGVAVYTNPTLTTGVDLSDAGNSPSWNISGLVYMPRAIVTWSGYIGKATNGLSCLVLVVDSLTINGTGAMLNNGDCEAQGLTPPTGPPHSKLVA